MKLDAREIAVVNPRDDCLWHLVDKDTDTQWTSRCLLNFFQGAGVGYCARIGWYLAYVSLALRPEDESCHVDIQS